MCEQTKTGVRAKADARGPVGLTQSGAERRPTEGDGTGVGLVRPMLAAAVKNIIVRSPAASVLR